ncbi:BrnA antitoxin family protein [Undibacterium pigrum]|uniref:BrnA antitoxin of type II toxin-antitoxin system n=1 Tax=Undibacterium pigrum TaxID=401470 RepID=A0A318J7E0_9BURK|nr:BrnA antitoxin family protein [Undibacterium pigrum]PXX42580.1 BrnA antitoxin of type II toxin-antitoxin system [Undibacterium pigrum]
MSKVSKTDWKRLEAMGDEDIDTSDIAELGEDFFQRAELRAPAKQTVTIRLDSDVLEWFKEQGQGYQTRINQLLRVYMETKQQKSN